MAKNVNGDLLQGTDELIYALFDSALWAYLNGEKTKEQALADFRTQSVASLSAETLKRLGLILNGVAPESPSTPVSNNTVATNVSGGVFKYVPNANEMGVFTDTQSGGKSTGKMNIGKEKIDGVEQTVINLTFTLNKGIEGPWCSLSIWGLTERAKTATGIRFKVYGDGKPWFFEASTKETASDDVYYRYKFDTINNKVSVIDIPFEKLKLVEWGLQAPFNKSKLGSFQFCRDGQFGLGASTIKIFDIEVY